MKPHRGFYSLIQFCPDASRLESVNVGVVLFCPELGFLDAQTSKGNRRAEKLVGRGNVEKAALNSAKRAIEERLKVDRESFLNLEDLQKYISTRGNWLKLTEARPVKVFDPPADLEKLFDELVGGKSLRNAEREKKELFPALRSAFEKLNTKGRAQLDRKIKVPVIERSLDIPYAYQDGVVNLIKPQRFSSKASQSIATAERLAIEGDLVNRHGIESGEKANLIVISKFGDAGHTDTRRRIEGLFKEFEIENISENRIDDFLQKVEAEAH